MRTSQLRESRRMTRPSESRFQHSWLTRAVSHAVCCRARMLVIFCVAVLTLAFPPHPLFAFEVEPATSQTPADADLLKKLIERLEAVEGELARLKAKQGIVEQDRKNQRVLALLEAPYLGTRQYGSRNGSRFFATRVMFVNLTPRAVTIDTQKIRLQADGVDYEQTELPSDLRHRSFPVGAQNFQIRNLKSAGSIRLAAGGTGSSWVIFPKLPEGRDVPKLLLKIDVDGNPIELDVNAFARGMLALDEERIGPQGSLALLTISGALNTINVGSLVAALDRVTARKVSRVVIRWTDSAVALDSQLLSWLQQVARQAGRGMQLTTSFPDVPVRIRELHLANTPSAKDTRFSNSSSNAPRRVHATDIEAVSFALRSAYQVLPRDELLKEIQQGHPLTRAAAIAGGGGRLPSDQLPLLLKYCDDNDVNIQHAAIFSLRHFGETGAIDKLVHYVRKNSEPLASVAIESLAASRFASAHQRLLAVLENESPASKKKIVKLLSQFPRPIWAETLYGYASNPNSGVSVDALRALVQIGHPQIVEALKTSLEQGDTELRNEAFKLLAARSDAASEELAMNHTLAHLRHSPPSNQMVSLLNRTRDSRAIAPLKMQLETAGGSRTVVINTLARIGDQSVAEAIVEIYPDLKNNEKTAALNALVQLRSTKFRELAGEALLTNDSSLINAACRGLQADGSKQAVQLLAVALEQSKSRSAWSSISNALSVLATAEARVALSKARDSKDTNKRNYARNALQNLQRRSPGYQSLRRAAELHDKEKTEEALQQYSLAIELDPQLSSAFTRRGNLYLSQKDYAKAKKDFAAANQLDPFDAEAVTGVAIVQVYDGDFEEGIKTVEKSRKRFSNDKTFAYNTACVYARALEHLRKDEASADGDSKAGEFQDKAIAELNRSVRLGFRNFDWKKKDPDLNSLHDVAEFQQIQKP